MSYFSIKAGVAAFLAFEIDDIRVLFSVDANVDLLIFAGELEEIQMMTGTQPALEAFMKIWMKATEDVTLKQFLLFEDTYFTQLALVGNLGKT